MSTLSGLLLEVRDLSTTFPSGRGRAKAVDRVSFEIRSGRTLCIVGESGCGKSVTALSILRLIQPPGRIAASSAVRFRGCDLLTLSKADMRRVRGRDIAMIFQEPMTSLNPVYTVGNQICETLRLHKGLGRNQAKEAATSLLSIVGIPDPERRMRNYPHQLSGGQRQRVMIAIALACEPKLLIADEPTTALDVTIQAQILELLKELRNRLGMAILLITHDLGVVAEMADDVAVMYGGRIVESGAAATIFASPQHPYTEALLHSIPLLGMTQAEPLSVIPGSVPDLAEWLPGCRFEPRCAHAFERCRDEEPSLLSVGDQLCACWLAADGPRPTSGVTPMSR